MTADHAPAPLLGGVGLLERAINYLLGVLHEVPRVELTAPTPCGDWNLRQLLAHLDESLVALQEATSGHVSLATAAEPSADPVAVLRDRASCLLSAWTHTTRTAVRVGDADLTTGIVATVGALEVAVHGWDVACAVGRGRPIPPALAAEMLALSRFLVSEADRPARFAAPVELPARAKPSDQLLAFLGRRP
ncbi:MAG: TIGR03086 family metal-binding protein [Actinophytocola sp.]|uniref:TIGR03086 family metal-binding protein n=1 Tax=Actinophytocola sp. TaxID=1872138 RepID=UPI003D6C66B2